MIKQEQKERIHRPAALRIYLQLCKHMEYIQVYPCKTCYVRDKSLIIERDVSQHIREIAGEYFEHYNLDTILDEVTLR